MAQSRSLTVADRERAAREGCRALSAFWGSKEADLASDCKQLELHIRHLLDRIGLNELSVKFSPKDRDSAVEKVVRKCNDEKSDYAIRILGGEQPQEIMTDLVRGRITCQFSDQIDTVAKLIRRHFVVNDQDSEDHRIPVDHGSFGYAALHLICEPVDTGKLQVYFSGQKFEVQIRSSLMDIWGVVNWDIDYKSDSKVPFEIRRRLSSISALFYLIDREFIGIRNEASGLQHNSPEGDGQSVSEWRSALPDSVKRPLKMRKIKLSDEEIEEILSIQGQISDAVGAAGLADQEFEVAFFMFDRERFRWMLDDDTIIKVRSIDLNIKP